MTQAFVRRWPLVPALVALAIQIVVIYSPTGVGEPPFPNFDKLVHCAVFALPVFFALLGRLPFVPVVALAAVHAPVSEIIQWSLLPNRSGDPWDALADLVGVGLGALAAKFALARVRSADRPGAKTG